MPDTPLPHASEPSNLALGVERIGLLSPRFPLVATVFLVALSIAAAFGVSRLKVDDSLSQLFRSDTPEFHLYEAVSRRFPSSEFDVLVVIEGKTLLARSSLQALRDLATDLQLIEGTTSIISLFSARQPPQVGLVPPPLVPDELPQGPEYDQLVQRVTSNEIIRGKLLSEDGQLALMVLALDPDVVASDHLGSLVGEIRKTVDQDLADSGLAGQLSGVPIMQLEIRNAVARDRLIYNAIGFALGCAIAILFFRRLSFMIVAAGPPLIAILLSLGALGWLGIRLNMFLNVMTPLIMVISFSDSMQLTFAARDSLLAGHSRHEAFRNAVIIVGPACVLTHATAALSFIALQFSSSALIRTFGEAGLMATVIALLAVLLLVPLLGVLLVRKEAALLVTARRTDPGVDLLRGFCRWIAARMVRRPGLYSAVAVLIVVALAINYARLEPRYRLADQVPDKAQGAVSASQRIDAKLTGANPVDVLIEFPAGQSLYSPQTLELIGETHAALEKQAGIGNVWSLETLRRWLAKNAVTSEPGTLQHYVEILPPQLTRRFISADQTAVVVSGRIPDIDASRILPVVEDLDRSLTPLRGKHPGYTIAVTGLAAIAARNGAEMIGRLNRAMTLEIIFVAAFIGLAFRSPSVMLASVLPGVFPILVSGNLLWAIGEGLQFASAVALIVSFGLGLSATIHFLNRLRREHQPVDDPAFAVERATILVGPALILTSVVLACGLAMMTLSDLPSLRLFGWLSAVAMMAALVADLLILRPTITFLQRVMRFRRGRG